MMPPHAIPAAAASFVPDPMPDSHGRKNADVGSQRSRIAPLRGLERFASLGIEANLHKRQTVFFQGDPAERCFEVIHGVMRLYRLLPDGRRQIVDFPFPGEVFGLSLGAGLTYAYCADAVTDATVRVYSNATLERHALTSPVLAHHLLALSHRDVEAARMHIVTLGRMTAAERVASFLLDLSRRAVDASLDQRVLWLPMNQADIADYLGLTTETVNRVISQFRERGIVSTPSRGIVRLERPGALDSIASPDLAACA